MEYNPIVTIGYTGLVCTKKLQIQERRRGGSGWTDSCIMTASICGKMVNQQDVKMRNVADCQDSAISGLIIHAKGLTDSSVSAVSGYWILLYIVYWHSDSVRRC